MVLRKCSCAACSPRLPLKESSLRNPKTAMAGYRLSSAEKMATSRKCQVSDRTGASGGGGLGATGGLGG